MVTVPEIYISADVEADGPIPGPFSMLSFGLTVAGHRDSAGSFHADDPTKQSFYRELRPIAETFLPDALDVSGLDRDELVSRGAPPEDAMSEAHDWITIISTGATPVVVGFPLLFDWMFLYWYFERFCEAGAPFEFSAGLDMKTMFQVKANIPLSEASLSKLPASLRSSRHHTHNALDDAIEQAEIFANLVAWDGDLGHT
jgi:hypothetical protein